MGVKSYCTNKRQVLDELHEAHTGSCKMKALARSYLWWPKLDYDIEKKVRECLRCQQNRRSPSPVPVHSWERPEQPWSRVHIDYAGPFMRCMFLVLVDAHSKWLECHIMSSITANKTMEKLRMIFSTHGLPKKIVSDNGPTFYGAPFVSKLLNIILQNKKAHACHVYTHTKCTRVFMLQHL